MYKSKKYNFMIILLLFIISAVAGVSAGMNAGTAFPGEVIIENPQGDTDDEQVVEPPSSIKAPSASAKPMTKVLFALDILNNGKGFRSESKQTLWINTLQIGQYMFFEKMSDGKQDIAQEWFKFSEQGGIFASSGKNEYRVQYTDGTTMKTKLITDRTKFDFDARSVEYGANGKLENFPYSDYINVQNRFHLNDFFLNIDNGSVGSIKEDKRSNALNYIITVEINISGLSQKYLNTFAANGGEDVTLEKITLNFHVSKKTGFLRKVKKSEQFTSAYGPFSGSCTTTLEENFYEMNVSKEKEINALVSKLFV
jgi:hypothetical protein